MPKSRPEEAKTGRRQGLCGFSLIVLQIVVIDLVFSINSIITAIGMAEDIEMMIAAVVIAMVVMYVASGRSRASSPSIRPPRCWHSRSWC